MISPNPRSTRISLKSGVIRHSGFQIFSRKICIWCNWRVVAHSECARAPPRMGRPPARRPPKRKHARACHEQNKFCYNASAKRVRATQQPRQLGRGENQNAPFGRGGIKPPSYNRTLKGNVSVSPTSPPQAPASSFKRRVKRSVRICLRMAGA
jgi:hypothetical protein